ncbi:GATA transcription factor 18 [Rhodamnia argentea]|uniref:GATA transcription factor 18 n=1 Tax=Rhodamnia argentea TaxID=178133 RepID=A0A8B8P3J5_9MYRT|nr:GATA transcription factor 18 [Rhodamnia argentea]
MMHRCSREPCPCGPFANQSASSFSMLFSKPFDHDDDTDLYYSSSSSSSSSVDCTLSLGTPSTRLLDASSDDHSRRNGEQHRRSSVSNFCWDVFQPKHAPHGKTSRGGGNQSAAAAAASDPLLARRCANCDTTSTPLWRNGPRGPKSLCNACGIRFKKEERRAAASGGGGGVADAQQHMYGHQWVQHAQAASQKAPSCFSPATMPGHHHHEFRFMEDDVVGAARDSSDGGGISFLSWRLNVTDRPSLVHDFTR